VVLSQGQRSCRPQTWGLDIFYTIEPLCTPVSGVLIFPLADKGVCRFCGQMQGCFRKMLNLFIQDTGGCAIIYKQEGNYGNRFGNGEN
jgi:hypothetical protein